MPVSILIFAFGSAAAAASDATMTGKPATPQTRPDAIVFTNGDQVSGRFVREVGGKITFQSDMLGEVTVDWGKVKELRTQTPMAVLKGTIPVRRRHVQQKVAEGRLTVVNQQITVQTKDGTTLPPIPTKSAQYIVDETTLRKQVGGSPGFFVGWNGTVTAGATIIEASQEQYTFTGALSLSRSVPTVSWLDTHNRTTLDFSDSYGEIKQPAYVSLSGTPPVPVYTPETVTKSSIYHADAERDEYFSPRVYALVQTAFDHNFGQNLDLQQIYGAGIGWTPIKRPKQELDLTATMQYESQAFIDATAGEDQNLVGSTFAGNYALKLPHHVVFKQGLSYIPAYNNPYAYSANESNTLTMPLFKSLSFSVGSIDSYLNDPPPAVPPTKRNSFQFTTGITYALKSKY